MAIRLTDSPVRAKKDRGLGARLVNDLPAPNRGSNIYYDGSPVGFALRVTARGVRSFVMSYTVRTNGIRRLKTIGRHGPDNWTVTAARKEALRLRNLINEGEDPMGELHAARQAPSVAELAERYCERRLPGMRPKTQHDDRAMLRLYVLPALGRLKVAEVRRADIAKLHRTLKDRPSRANRMVSLCSRMFSFAIREDMRAGENPAIGVEQYPEERRERYLSQAELVRLTEALGKCIDQQPANVIRMLLLTGARRGEVLHMEWKHLDLEEGVWTKPSTHTKQKKMHRVPLNRPARELLSKVKAHGLSERYVFAGRQSGKPLRDLHRKWKAICKEADIEDLRMHDLRHSYASFLVSAGLSLPVIGALLGHAKPSTTARYAHLFDDPLREATERVGVIVEAAGKLAAEVAAYEDEFKACLEEKGNDSD
jgi:integrase